MRKGDNPTKGSRLITKQPCNHRIIIPVHIPHETDYYKDAYKIFELCVLSVIKTSISELKISIISNRCSDAVNTKLFEFCKIHQIDEFIIEKEGVGKINSILKALRTAEERLITITDADVLFLNNWETEILKVFEAFPKAGAVCPVPVYRKHLQFTANIWLRHLRSKKLRFSPVKDRDGLEMFVKSLGWQYLPEEYGDSIGTLEGENGTIATLGCSHFCATYKREVFSTIPKTNTPYLIEGNSEYLYLDKPVALVDGYRLSTQGNYAYHLGNTFENWMSSTFNNLKNAPKKLIDFEHLAVLKPNKIAFIVFEKLFRRLLVKPAVLKYLYKKKGLTSAQIRNYIPKS